VQQFNTRIQQFPASIVAGQMGFNAPKQYFEITEAAEREAPQVSFSESSQPSPEPGAG
jgi:hypothetical protein